MTCLSRKDPTKDLFTSRKSNTNRRNLFSSIKVANNSIICQNDAYQLNGICEVSGDSQSCILLDSGEEVELNPGLSA